MTDDSLVPIHTAKDLENARYKGKVIGWVQGGGAVFALGLVLNFVGWIPVLVVGGGVAYLAYRVLTPRRK